MRLRSSLVLSLLTVLGVAGCSSSDGSDATPGADAGVDANEAGDEVATDAAPAKTHVLPAACGVASKKFTCDPLTNAGCDAAAGEACDYDGSGDFGCVSPPNDGALGDACDGFTTTCGGGLTCAPQANGDVCAKYCCADSECDASKGETCLALGAASVGSVGACGKAPAQAVAAACGASSAFFCDPITNAPCGTDEACDFSSTGFRCYAPPNTAAAGEACDLENGPNCMGGLTCMTSDPTDPSVLTGVCAKFCCADAECGDGKVCAGYGMTGAGSLGNCAAADGGAPDAGADDAAAEAAADAATE